MAETTRRELIQKTAALGLGAFASAAVPLQSAAGRQQAAQKTNFFPSFLSEQISTAGATIHCVYGGKGPPALFLHGNPETHLEWRKLAPVLAQEFSVVMTDLRGYGDSSKPPDGENHAGYSKRAMAQDQVEVMEHLGFRKFAVVGHDRGGRVGHRLARDFPGRVTKLAVIDIVPTYTVYHDLTQQSATALFHWFLLIQPEPFPETLIGNSADFFLKSMMLRGAHPAWMEKEALDEYLRCFRDPAHIHAMCEDYRASASIDLAHDEANLSERIACPLLVLWGKEGPIGRFYNPLDVWRQRASNVKGQQIPGRHFLPEESPREVLEQLKSFLHS